MGRKCLSGLTTETIFSGLPINKLLSGYSCMRGEGGGCSPLLLPLHLVQVAGGGGELHLVEVTGEGGGGHSGRRVVPGVHGFKRKLKINILSICVIEFCGHTSTTKYLYVYLDVFKCSADFI